MLIVQARYRGHGLVADGPTAALLIDAKDVVRQYPELTELRGLTDEDEKVYLNSVKNVIDVSTFKLAIYKEVNLKDFEP